MTNGLTNNSSEPTKVDTAASESCTRSGVFALLLTVTLSLLVPYWVERRNEDALGKYISDRVNLANQIERLDEDLLWKEYKASNKAAESMSIAELMKVSVEGPKSVPEVGAQTKASSTTKAGVQRFDPSRPTTPRPPTGLTVSSPPAKLEVLLPIVDLLNQLNDPELLNRVRKVSSNSFEFSIIRWATKRGNLMYENMVRTMPTNNCFSGWYWEIPYKEQKVKDFVPALDKDALLNCLTLRDVRELAQFELPTFSNPIQLKGSIHREVDVNPSSLMPRDLYTASVLLQLLLFFVIVHFAAFAREAVSSAKFPVQGTLFSAFYGSRGTLLVFLFALWSPLCASLTVVVASRSWSLIPYSVLIGCAVSFTYLVLQRKSFFGALNLMNIAKDLRRRVIKIFPFGSPQRQ